MLKAAHSGVGMHRDTSTLFPGRKNRLKSNFDPLTNATESAITFVGVARDSL